MNHIKVSYLTKDREDQQLIERSKVFGSIEEAIGYIKELRNSRDTVGYPMLEEIGFDR